MDTQNRQPRIVGTNIASTKLCDTFGINQPIFAFTHSLDTVAAVSRCGGLGVYGATRRTPEEIRSNAAVQEAYLGAVHKETSNA